MFRKADRDNLIALKTLLVALPARLRAHEDSLRGDLDKLLQSHAALELELNEVKSAADSAQEYSKNVWERMGGFIAKMEILTGLVERLIAQQKGGQDGIGAEICALREGFKIQSGTLSAIAALVSEMGHSVRALASTETKKLKKR